MVADIEITEQRTKLDVFEDALFLVAKMIYPDQVQPTTHVEQISFYLKENILITFQEKPKDIFEPIRSLFYSFASPSIALPLSFFQIEFVRTKVVFVDQKSIIYSTLSSIVSSNATWMS